MSTVSFGVLSKNAGFYPSSDRIVEINTWTLGSGTWRQIIQQTNILPTLVGLPVHTQRLSGSHVGLPPCQWLNAPIYRRSRPLSWSATHIRTCQTYSHGPGSYDGSQEKEDHNKCPIRQPRVGCKHRSAYVHAPTYL